MPLSEGAGKGGRYAVPLSEGGGEWCLGGRVPGSAEVEDSHGWVPGACLIGGKTLEAAGGVGTVTAGAVNELVVGPDAGAVVTNRAGAVVIVAGAGGGGGGAGGSVAVTDGAIWLSES